VPTPLKPAAADSVSELEVLSQLDDLIEELELHIAGE
jgi:hypothetical protein